MNSKVRLWIDHKKAIVVAVTDKGEEIALIIETVDKMTNRQIAAKVRKYFQI